MEKETDRWIFHGEPGGADRIGLFCFPYAGGGASFYARWKSLFPEYVNLLPVQLPGREDRMDEEGISSADTILDRMADALAPHMRTPFAFWGHSMGGLLAYRLSCRLSEKGMPLPLHAFLSASPPPCGSSGESGSSCSTEELLRKTDGIPEAVRASEELMKDFIRTAESDCRLVPSLRTSRSSIPVPLTVMAGEEDAMVPLREIEQWEKYAGLGMALQTFPGGHFFLKENREGVVSLISETLLMYLI